MNAKTPIILKIPDDATRFEYIKKLPEDERIDILKDLIIENDYSEDSQGKPSARLIALCKAFDDECGKIFEDLKKEFSK